MRQLQQDAPTIENVARAELGLIKAGRDSRRRQITSRVDTTDPCGIGLGTQPDETAMREARP